VPKAQAIWRWPAPPWHGPLANERRRIGDELLTAPFPVLLAPRNVCPAILLGPGAFTNNGSRCVAMLGAEVRRGTTSVAGAAPYDLNS
jgi:hypothetical protein